MTTINIVTVVGTTNSEEKRIPNSVMKLDLGGTRRVNIDIRYKMLSYMLNYVNCMSYISRKNASHSTSKSLTHRSMKV